MTGTSWETEIADLLEELSTVQEELLQVLAEKRDRMAAHDMSAMDEIQQREEALCLRLDACREKRSELLRSAADEGLPSGSLRSLTKSLPPESRGSLERQVKDNSQRLRLLQHHSLTNWVLAQRTLLHLSQMLEILATGGRLKPTYEKGKSTGVAQGALMDREA